jgi:hypothetical protein
LQRNRVHKLRLCELNGPVPTSVSEASYKHAVATQARCSSPDRNTTPSILFAAI